MKAERSPTHGGFPRPLKKTHIKEKLRFMKRCHAVVPRTGVKQSWLTEQELNRGGTRVRWCPTAEKKILAEVNICATQQEFPQESDKSSDMNVSMTVCSWPVNRTLAKKNILTKVKYLQKNILIYGLNIPEGLLISMF